jgi:hypothetical protein
VKLLQYLSNVERRCSYDEEDKKPAATEKSVTKNAKNKTVAKTRVLKNMCSAKKQSTVTAAALPAKEKSKKSTAVPSNKPASAPSKNAAPAMVAKHPTAAEQPVKPPMAVVAKVISTFPDQIPSSAYQPINVPLSAYQPMDVPSSVYQPMDVPSSVYQPMDVPSLANLPNNVPSSLPP